MGLVARLRRLLRRPAVVRGPSDASCSACQRRGVTERVILALADDIHHVPSHMGDRRIADCLKRIAQGEIPTYHPKMRAVDVQALETYRHRLRERQRRQRPGCAVQHTCPSPSRAETLLSVSESILRIVPGSSGLCSYWPCAF